MHVVIVFFVLDRGTGGCLSPPYFGTAQEGEP